MYLSQSLSWKDKCHDMVGVIAAQTRMHAKSQGRGYVKLRQKPGQHPWKLPGQAEVCLHAHEFHYSTLQGLAEDAQFAYQVLRGTGIAHQQDGFVYKNLLASYSHLRNTSACPWVRHFLGFVRKKRLLAITDTANAL